jgi:hypothetical protein
MMGEGAGAAPEANAAGIGGLGDTPPGDDPFGDDPFGEGFFSEGFSGMVRLANIIRT